MRYIKEKNIIRILDLTDFNIVQILECGQIFRFNINKNFAVVYACGNFQPVSDYPLVVHKLTYFTFVV